jgi:hydroxymethylpyrimidine/phosphomethylpyrimidine kinase
VLRASSGTPLLDPDGIIALREELAPLALILLPNAIEAGVLLGRPPAMTIAEMHEHAELLHCGFGPGVVLIKGGHVDTGDIVTEVSYYGDGHGGSSGGPRVRSVEMHGTGCTHSAAVAALLALGHELDSACSLANAYVADAIVASSALRPSAGRRSLNHIPFTGLHYDSGIARGIG